MPDNSVNATRLKQLLLSTSSKPQLEKLKRQVRKWSPSGGATGQEAINRAMVQAVDELHARIDLLLTL